MSDFSTIASFYREKSHVQANAGKQLIDLLKIAPDADILDVGCGTGNLCGAASGGFQWVGSTGNASIVR